MENENSLKIESLVETNVGSKLATCLANVSYLPDELAYRLVKQEYKSFLYNIEKFEELNFLKENTRFITFLIQVCMEEELSYEDRIYCNSMIYNMFPVNQYLAKLYTFLSTIVNNNMTHKIMNICEFNQVSSSYIAVARKSSFSFDENITRLISSIICIGLDVSNNISVDKIEKLFNLIYPDTKEISQVFLHLLKDNYIYRSDEDWITSDIIYISNMINKAVLNIIESKDEPVIDNILMQVHNMISIEGLEYEDLRFSLKKLDKSIYPKINTSINNLYRNDIYLK